MGWNHWRVQEPSEEEDDGCRSCIRNGRKIARQRREEKFDALVLTSIDPAVYQYGWSSVAHARIEGEGNSLLRNIGTTIWRNRMLVFF